MEKIKVIYICPMGSSGTTLLDLLLANHSDIQSLGEVISFDEWWSNDLRCSCSQKMSECPFWLAIVNQLEEKGPFRLEGVIRSFLANGTPLLSCWSSKKANAYAQRTYSLFSVVKDITGKEFILDSSKSLGRLKMLILSGVFDIYVLHLVRNGKAYVASNLEPKDRPSFEDGRKTKVLPVYKSSLRWFLCNYSLDRIAAKWKLQYKRINYEQLVLDTAAVVNSVCSFLDIAFSDSLLTPRTDDIHNISGSRWRYREDVAVRNDYVNSQQLTGINRLIFKTIAGKMNKRYGY
jgi:hypothetical protein